MLERRQRSNAKANDPNKRLEQLASVVACDCRVGRHHYDGHNNGVFLTMTKEATTAVDDLAAASSLSSLSLLPKSTLLLSIIVNHCTTHTHTIMPYISFFSLLNRLASAIPLSLSRVPSFDTTLLCSSRRNTVSLVSHVPLPVVSTTQNRNKHINRKLLVYETHLYSFRFQHRSKFVRLRVSIDFSTR